MSDRLSALDATFLHVEDDVSHMSIASLGIFEGPAPSHDELVALVAARLHRVPRLRQRIRFVPFDAGRPVWVDDPSFDVRFHVRRTAVPPPGGDAELQTLMGRVMARQLDRARPLWELWAVEGLPDGRWGLISKMHHAMVDGVSGSTAITSLLDVAPDALVEDAPAWEPAPEPSDAALVVGAVVDRLRSPLGLVRGAAHPRAIAGRVGSVVSGLGAYAGVLRPPPPTALNGAVGAGRRWAWSSLAFDDVRTVRRTHGGTVNDVVLAAVCEGFRALFEARGDPVPATIRTLVPVSVRSAGTSGEPCNRVSAIFAALPVGIADPVERLAAVRAELGRLKAAHEPEAGELLTALAGAVPEVVLDWSGRLAARLPQHAVSTVVTNVPGPAWPLWLAGRPLLATYPYVPLGGHVRIGVAVYSYDGTLTFGVTGDFDAAPDVGVVAEGIVEGLDALLRAPAAA